MELEAVPVDEWDAPADPPPPKKRKGPKVALYGALAAVVVGGVALVASRGTTESPEEELAALQSFVGDAGSAHFEGSHRSEMGPGDDEVGSTSVDITKLEGDLKLPESGRYLVEDGYSATEYIVVDDRVWERSADERSGLDGEQWVSYDEPDVEDDGAAAPQPAVAAASGAFDVIGAPVGLKDLLSRMRQVDRPEPGTLEAVTTVGDLLSPEEKRQIEQAEERWKEQIEEIEAEAAAGGDEAEAADAQLEAYDSFAGFEEILDDKVTVTLRHTDGRLDRLTIVHESSFGFSPPGAEGDDEEETSVDTVDVRFTRWGEAVDVAAPDAADVDATPNLDAEDLAAFRSFTPLMLGQPPAGMHVDGGSVVEDDPEVEQCESVELSYSAPFPEDGDHTPSAYLETPSVSISQYASSCKWPYVDAEMLEDARPVTVGGLPAQVVEEKDPYGPGSGTSRYVVFTRDGVLIEIRSTLPEADMLAVAGTMVPMDVDALLAAYED